MKNAKALAAALISRGEIVITGGTDSHMVLWDVRPHGLTGPQVDKAFEALSMTVNKCTLVGDKS